MRYRFGGRFDSTSMTVVAFSTSMKSDPVKNVTFEPFMRLLPCFACGWPVTTSTPVCTS